MRFLHDEPPPARGGVRSARPATSTRPAGAGGLYSCCSASRTKGRCTQNTGRRRRGTRHHHPGDSITRTGRLRVRGGGCMHGRTRQHALGLHRIRDRPAGAVHAARPAADLPCTRHARLVEGQTARQKGSAPSVLCPPVRQRSQRAWAESGAEPGRQAAQSVRPFLQAGSPNDSGTDDFSLTRWFSHQRTVHRGSKGHPPPSSAPTGGWGGVCITAHPAVPFGQGAQPMAVPSYRLWPGPQENQTCKPRGGRRVLDLGVERTHRRASP